MGILNVTPDSFSDGGKFNNSNAAFDYAMNMIKEGADIIDVGGESTRPGSDSVSEDEELNRVIPVINKIAQHSSIPISIDTCKSSVAQQALESGAVIVNDISGLAFDEKMAHIVSRTKAGVIIMHIKGTPKTMQNDPHYNNVVREIQNVLENRITFALNNGIDKTQIVLDPGIGFGKTVEDNFVILRELKKLQTLSCPILIGPSRKSFIGNTLNLPVNERIEGTAAAVTAGILNGAHIIRVHDVKEMKRVAVITDAIAGKN